MDIAIIIVVILIAFAALIFSGGMIVQNKSAVKYMESNEGRQASFVKCNGTIRRQFRTKVSGTYHFRLEQQLSEGTFQIQILDRKKKTIGQLDDNVPELDLNLAAKERYYMLSVFTNATGSYQFFMTNLTKA